MKSLALAFLLSLSHLPGVFPERPKFITRLGQKHKAAVLYWSSIDLEPLS